MSETAVLEQLVALSNALGRPELDYVILGEGNTSARADEASFWVKASGTELRTITAAGFVHVAFDRVLALLDRQGLTDQEVKAGLAAAKVDPDAPGHPSVETLLHALCLRLPEVNFVGHTHPVAVNQLLCSKHARTFAKRRTFPDEIVCCGVESVLVPYVDPGLKLPQAIRRAVLAFIKSHWKSREVLQARDQTERQARRP